jgi:hypothetical protein
MKQDDVGAGLKSQILRMLPKLEELRRGDSSMPFDELSIVSKKLVSLTCVYEFDFDTADVDISFLIITHLENVKFVGKNASELQFITSVLDNSIPQGREYLKSLC